MARFTVKIIGADKFAQNQLKFIKDLSDRQVREIARETAIVMQDKIQQSITRAGSTGNLQQSIFSEKIRGGYGVGNINFLNTQAPYWRHVNFGSQAIGASHSHRVPQGGFNPGNPAPGGAGNGRWIVGSGSFSFRPTKPIAPLNYIAKTLQEIPNITNRVLSQG